jgi:hypothetical protein
MKLYIRHHDDYRSGVDITVYDTEDLKIEYESENESENDELITDEKFNIKLDMDEDMLDIVTLNNKFNDTYAIYLICGNGYHDPEKTNTIHVINQNNKDDANKILQNLYSDINNCQPFLQTGYTVSYKQEGYYPEPLSKYFIDGQPLISEEIKMILDRLMSYCVAVVIYNDKLVDYIQINPR